MSYHYQIQRDLNNCYNETKLKTVIYNIFNDDYYSLCYSSFYERKKLLNILRSPTQLIDNWKKTRDLYIKIFKENIS